MAMLISQSTKSVLKSIALGAVAIFTCLISPEVFAAGGLDAGITATSELKSTAYKWLAVVASGYIIFNVVMAYLGRKGWGDVAMAVMYCAIAGGAIALGDYAWSIFS